MNARIFAMPIRVLNFYFSPVISRIRRIGLFLLLALFLVACQGPMQKEAPPENLEPAADLPPTPDEILPPSKRVSKAIQALQIGDKEHARNQLTWALQSKPNLRVAKKLLAQMDADPVEYLGSKYFTYRVLPGDSLSVIAKNYLDDPLKFVILARYNSIDNPRELKAGQQIKIPGEFKSNPNQEMASLPVGTTPVEQSNPDQAVPTAVTEPPLAPQIETDAAAAPALGRETPSPPAEHIQTPELTAQQADKRHAAGDLPGAIMLMEQTNNLADQSKAFRAQLLGYYGEQAERLAAQGKLNDARVILEKAVTIDSSSDSTINKLIEIEDQMEAQRLYLQGQQLLKAGQLEEAHSVFSQAYAYEPSNSTIAAANKQARGELTDRYHRKAVQLFRKHELNKAIEFWDKILAIDPQHNLAPGYRARAVELKSKLQKIGQ